MRLEPGHAIQDREPGFGFGQGLLGERFKTRRRRRRHRTRIRVREAVQPDPRLVDTCDRYPYKLAGRPVESRRAALPVGEHG